MIDVPDGTTHGHGVALFIAGNPKPYHGTLLLDGPIGILVDIFPFKPASAPTTSARRGIVRLAGRMLIDDDGPFNPLVTTMLYAVGRSHVGEGDRVDANFKWVRSKRFDAVRALAQVAPNGKWAACPVDPLWPTYIAELANTIDRAYDHGLRTKVTVIGGGDRDPTGTARKVANAIAGREHKVLLLEAVNEHNADVEDAKRMIPILKGTGCLVIPGFGDITSGWGIPELKDLTAETGAHGCALHTERGDGDNGARQVRQCWDFHLFSSMADDGEGPGPGASVASFPGIEQNAAKAAGNMICGASLRCLHTGDGVYGESYQGPTGPRYANLYDRPGADAMFEAVRHADDHLTPDIANWTKYNNGHPVEIASGTVNKLYGAKSNTGQYAQIAIGCETPVSFKATRNVTLRLFSPSTGESLGEYALTAGQVCQPTSSQWSYIMTGEM